MARRDESIDIIQAVHDQVSKVAAITGISIGDISDKSSWRIDFSDQATTNERTAALTAISSFIVNNIVQKVFLPKEVILDRLGDTKVSAILASTNPAVHVWLEKFRAANDPININDTRFVAGFAFLVSLGILTESDVATVRDA